MKMLLTSFRREFHDRLLDLLWRQWTALGVTGQVSPCKRTVLDPEALLLISCTVGRHDARLFDAMLEWLQVNGRISVTTIGSSGKCVPTSQTPTWP